MSLDTKDTIRLIELAARPSAHEQNGVGGVRYRVVEDNGRYVVLVLRDGQTPQVSRYRKTLREAKVAVENLVVIGRTFGTKRAS